MRHQLLSSSITTATATTMSSSSKPHKKPTNSNLPNYPQNSSSPPSTTTTTTTACKHTSPSATTLDLLILVLVLFSFTFLICSYFSYIFQSLSLLIPPNYSFSFTSLLSQFYQNLLNPNTNYLFYTLFTLFFITTLVFFDICCVPRSRKCGKVGCKGLKKALEFDLQLQGEKCLRSDSGKDKDKKGSSSFKEIDELPWKGGSENNPDYECLRAELRKMAPPNGKAVLLFRAKCGCPIAKLEGWGPKRGRRPKKSLGLNGGGDHR